MPTKTKLEQAVAAQASNLDPAQHELVMAQFATYMWNKDRIKRIENRINVIDMGKEPPVKGERKQLMTERHQLTVDNVSISTKLFMQLKGTGDETDELDKFLQGE